MVYIIESTTAMLSSYTAATIDFSHPSPDQIKTAISVFTTCYGYHYSLIYWITDWDSQPITKNNND